MHQTVWNYHYNIVIIKARLKAGFFVANNLYLPYSLHMSIKTMIKKSTIYIAAFLALFLLPKAAFAQIRNWDDPNGDGDKTDSCLIDGVPTLKCLEVVFANLLFMTNALILIVLFIMFVIGSFKWLTSLGDPEKVTSAQNTFKWAIIGLVVYVSSYLILRIIDVLLLGGEGKIFIFQIGG